MCITVHLGPEEVAQIKHFTGIQNENEPVPKALLEFLRVMKLRELKSVSGKVDYADAGDAQEALELRELPPGSL
jgi:hypothetical protein